MSKRVRPTDLLLRCMVWRDGDLWVAVCIDLTLAAQAFSPDEARRKLHAQIEDYVREALTVDSEHAAELLTRKAHPWERARYHFWQLITNRPRVRRTAGRLARRLRLGISNKLAYMDAMPFAA